MIDLFIKSYPRDYKYLEWALKSISKFVVGYNRIHVVIPKGSNINNLELPDNCSVHQVKEEGNGYLFQQYIKMTAHHYCQGDYILFTDSDCIFNRGLDVNSLIDSEGKVRLLKTSYAKVGDAICYKKPTEAFFDNEYKIEHEYMRRNGMIFHRDTLINLETFKPNAKHIILNAENATFSEFNVMGFFAAQFHKKYYNVIDTDEWEFEEHWMTQFWSWGGFDNEKEQIKKILQ